MKFYYAWGREGETYDEGIHCREDEKIISFSMDQKEGEFAYLRVQIPVDHQWSLIGKTWGFFSCDMGCGPELLFQGRLLGMPTSFDGEWMTLELEGRPFDQCSKIKALVKTLQVAPYWDPLFVGKDDLDDPVEVLDGRQILYYWNPKTHEVTLSDLFEGRETKNLNNAFYDSLKIRVGEAPYSACEVTVTARWVQRYEGQVNASPYLERAFAEGLPNTFTGADLKLKWWLKGEHMGRSGYAVDWSELEEINPNGAYYSGWSPPLGDPNNPKFLKRHWFFPNLRLGWKYQQRRKETARFTLQNDLKSGIEGGEVKHLNLNLQNICHDGEHGFWQKNHLFTVGYRVLHEGCVYSCIESHTSEHYFEDAYWQQVEGDVFVPSQETQSTFFLTERGKEALNHALEVAKSYLAGSLRSVEISVQAPFEELMDISLEHSVVLEDSRLPGGRVQGKVIRIQLIGKGEGGRFYGEITLGCSVGNGSQGEVKFQNFDHLGPTKGILRPEELRSSDLIQSVKIINPPGEQLEHLMAQGEDVSDEHLREKTTDVLIELRDIRTSVTLDHEIPIALNSPWSGPSHFDERREV